MTVIDIKQDCNLYEFSSELPVYTLKNSIKQTLHFSVTTKLIPVDVFRPQDEVAKKKLIPRKYKVYIFLLRRFLALQVYYCSCRNALVQQIYYCSCRNALIQQIYYCSCRNSLINFCSMSHLICMTDCVNGPLCGRKSFKRRDKQAFMWKSLCEAKKKMAQLRGRQLFQLVSSISLGTFYGPHSLIDVK